MFMNLIMMERLSLTGTRTMRSFLSLLETRNLISDSDDDGAEAAKAEPLFYTIHAL